MAELSNKDYFDLTKNVRTAREAFCYANTIDSAVASELIRINIIEKVADDFANTTEQGNALEEVVHYFLMNSGVFEDVERNDKNLLHDLDHWANFSFFIVPYLASMRINFAKFLGESKNYLNSGLKVDIAYKVEGLKMLIGASVGCYFTRSGLKGRNFAESAKGVSRQFTSRFENFSIVFTDKDWSFLQRNPQKFGSLLYEKINLCSNQNDTENVNYSKL